MGNVLKGICSIRLFEETYKKIFHKGNFIIMMNVEILKF